MLRPNLIRAAAGLLAAAAIISAQVIGAAPAQAAVEPAAVRVLYYDASRAGEFINVVHQGAANWNARVTSVRLERWTSGKPRNITVYVDNGWPRAYPGSLGNGYFYMGRQAVQQGHNPTRIAAHEMGHLLGLPDRRTGICTELMSGSSAGTSCTSAFPNARETAEVNALFGGSLVAASITATVY